MSYLKWTPEGTLTLTTVEEPRKEAAPVGGPVGIRAEHGWEGMRGNKVIQRENQGQRGGIHILLGNMK